jgi:hypothetical protein
MHGTRTPIPGSLIVQALIILAFAMAYCMIYSFLCELVFKKLERFAAWYR